MNPDWDDLRGSSHSEARSSTDHSNGLLELDETTMVSRSQAAKIRSQHHSEVRRQNQERKDNLSSIHKAVGDALSSPAIVQEAHLPQDKAIMPFFIHPSHEPIFVGGFVACVRCGVANSQPRARSQLPISTQCEPNTHGDMRPKIGQGQRKLSTAFQNLRRLKRGRPPYGYKRWPDGDDEEVVKQVFVLTPSSEDPEARLYVPTSGP